jgi:hypothetical protein
MDTNLDKIGLTEGFLVASLNYPWSSYPPYSYIMCRVQAPHSTSNIHVKVLDFALGDPDQCADKFRIKSRRDNLTVCGSYASLRQSGSLEVKVDGNWMEVMFESFAAGTPMSENRGFLFQINGKFLAPVDCEVEVLNLCVCTGTCMYMYL